uniref:14-3-3 protein 7-like n=1 Tax=Rhizophora mucronata TaxID=61149 RepID=A0A2P2KCQ4_RHIMU
MKNPTRIAHSSCNFLGIISLYGPQICQRREVIAFLSFFDEH